MKRFHPRKKHPSRNQFEGWYTRLQSPDSDCNLAIIMAYTTNANDPHAFIQVFDGLKNTNRYHRFPIDAYRFDDGVAWIADNYVSPRGLHLNLDGCAVDVTFSDASTLNGSAMGYLSSFPLQCYQEVVLLDGRFTGTMNTASCQGKQIGTLYMEKTFGKRFPKRWFWLQANRFGDAALSMAGGHVPTLFFKPFGYFAIFRHGNHTHTFATYNRAKLSITEHDDTVVFTLKKRRFRLTIKATKATPTELVGPTDKGAMTLPVHETLTAHVSVRLMNKDEVLYEGESPLGGFEWMMYPKNTKET